MPSVGLSMFSVFYYFDQQSEPQSELSLLRNSDSLLIEPFWSTLTEAASRDSTATSIISVFGAIYVFFIVSYLLMLIISERYVLADKYFLAGVGYKYAVSRIHNATTVQVEVDYFLIIFCLYTFDFGSSTAEVKAQQGSTLSCCT